jgi:hypothetical protein
VAVEKVSLSLDPDVVAEARELAGRGGLSALVNDAVRIRLQHIRITRLLDAMDDEFGSVPDDVVEEVGHRWRALDEAG